MRSGLELPMNSYVLALCANLSFAIGSQFFTHFTRLFSSTWVNCFKAIVASIAFCLTVLLSTGFHNISIEVFSIFLLSGAIGLGVGDIFLLKAFGEIGPGRSMVIFGFHPIVIGIISYFLFAQELDYYKLWGIIFFMICLFIFSLESFKESGNWKIKGLLFAFLGMLLDAAGVLLTRFAFDQNSSITPLEGNFHRCIGALIVYVCLRPFWPFQFQSRLKSMSKASLWLLLIGTFFGTYLSLSLYLKSIQIADNLALISSISITSVLFSSLIECIWERKMPSRYLILSLISFSFGMYFIFK